MNESSLRASAQANDLLRDTPEAGADVRDQINRRHPVPVSCLNPFVKGDAAGDIEPVYSELSGESSVPVLINQNCPPRQPGSRIPIQE